MSKVIPSKSWRTNRLTVAAVVIVGVVLGVFGWYESNKSKYPFGHSHCCIALVAGALEQYAAEHGGRYPSGGSSPEASLSLLFRSNYLDAHTLRGMIVPESTVRAILDSGGDLGPETCGWHYTDGLTRADDTRIALLYCKEALGHNGNRAKDGGRQVVFVDGPIEWISGEKWPAFLAEQEVLLSNRTERPRTGSPLVDAVIELQDGRRIETLDASYTLRERQAGRRGSGSSDGQSSGNSFNRDSLVWYRVPSQSDFSGFITRTLLFSNLSSGPVTVKFTNGIPDTTNVVFKMLPRQ